MGETHYATILVDLLYIHANKKKDKNTGCHLSPNIVFFFKPPTGNKSKMMQVFQCINVDQYLTVYSVAAQRIQEALKRKEKETKENRQ